MIFISKNEDGIPHWKLILMDIKTVTRRMKPITPGSIRAVQPGRTMKGIGFIEILDYIPHSDWWDLNCHCSEDFLQNEARLEGFNSWGGLLSWFKAHKIDINDTFRHEFRRVEL